MLEHAAASADQAIVAILLEAGADPGASGGVSTPLIEASSRGNTGIAQQLLTAGADVNGIDGTGRTPLMAAVEQGGVGLVEVLLKPAPIPIFARNWAARHWVRPSRHSGNRWWVCSRNLVRCAPSASI